MKHPQQSIAQRLVEQINADCEAGRWFWVAGLAREVWPVLLPVRGELHAVAQTAVEPL